MSDFDDSWLVLRWRAAVCTDRRGRLFLLEKGGRRCCHISAVRGRCRPGVVSTPSDKPHSTLDKANQKYFGPDVQIRPPIAAMSDPGHFGAAMLWGPTVRLKCSATNTTPAHRCLLSPWCGKTVGPAQHILPMKITFVGLGIEVEIACAHLLCT